MVVGVAAFPASPNTLQAHRLRRMGKRSDLWCARASSVAALVTWATVLLVVGTLSQPQMSFSWVPSARRSDSRHVGSTEVVLAGSGRRASPLGHAGPWPGKAPAPAATAALPAALLGGGAQVKHAAVSLWFTSGIGPLLLGIWSKLAPYPPFSWAVKLFGMVAAAPAFYRYYLAYSLGTMVLKKVIPGTYAQLTTGTWLGFLKATSSGAYADAVATRLQGLLLKQAALKAGKGKPKPDLSKTALDAMSQQLKSDPVLLDALGSTTALGMWHKLEKTPLEDPSLVEGTPRDSQARWLVEALRAGYLGDVEAAARKNSLEVSAANAAQNFKRLAEAVDAAAFRARYEVHATGAGSAMANVEEASASAAASIKALEDSRSNSEENDVSGDDRVAWNAKLQELLQLYADVPAVANELNRLSRSTSSAPA